jgi:catechol 2,3-dioxygenase-like lactoylglutathione lyase family enzyme
VFDHVTIRVSDLAAAEAFYELVLGTLGIEISLRGNRYVEWDEFALASADVATTMMAASPPTKRLHVAFAAPSRGLVDEFWRVGTGAGYRDDGAPGPRPQYSPDYYGAFLLDPDGNSAEAVHHGEQRTGIDHLWVGVADVEASKRFYELVAPFGGYRLGNERPGFAHFDGERGSFSVIEREPTEHVHVAFPASDNATVDAFHRAATEAGYRDNGQPGERPVYHEGYYGAFVLDPDGNNVEVVCHNR